MLSLRMSSSGLLSLKEIHLSIYKYNYNYLPRVHHNQISTSKLLLPVIDSLRHHMTTSIETLRVRNYIHWSLFNKDTFIMRTGSVGPMVSLIKRLHCTCIKDR